MDGRVESPTMTKPSKADHDEAVESPTMTKGSKADHDEAVRKPDHDEAWGWRPG